MINIKDLYRNYKDYRDKAVPKAGCLGGMGDFRDFVFVLFNNGHFFEQLHVE